MNYINAEGHEGNTIQTHKSLDGIQQPPLPGGYFLQVISHETGEWGKQTRLHLGRGERILVMSYNKLLRPGAGLNDVHCYYACHFFSTLHRVGLGEATAKASAFGYLWHENGNVGIHAYALVEVPGEGFILELIVVENDPDV